MQIAIEPFILPKRLPHEADLAVVRDSLIHGKGLFAAHALCAGEVVMRMNPDDLSEKKRHPWNGRNSDTLPFFVNHSCDANAAVFFSLVDRAMIVTTTRFIRADEEITIDYFLLEVGGKRIPCHCGAANCHGEFPVNPRGSW